MGKGWHLAVPLFSAFSSFELFVSNVVSTFVFTKHGPLIVSFGSRR